MKGVTYLRPVKAMAVLNKLLNLLSDGECHSGQDLGHALGVSRAAVWKHLKKLSDLGLSLNIQRGRGYQLVGGLELLNANCIKEHLQQKAANNLAQLRLESVVDSTNTQLMQQAQMLESGSVCLAEQQTSGRGRRGRVWVSPFAKNIYMSLLWHFDGGAAELEGLSLAVGVAIARALRACGIEGVQLKWPNDVLVEGRKLAGVLLEMGGDPSGSCHVVVGVGINVSMPKQAGESIDQPWTDILQITAQQGLSEISRNKLVGVLLSELLLLLQQYPAKGFSDWQGEWMALGLHIGCKVQLSTQGSVRSGTMLGVSPAGALRLDVGGVETLFYGGEVSLRAVS